MNKTCVIIGLGQIGMNYDYKHTAEKQIFSHVNAIDKHPNFKLLGAVDTSYDQRVRFKNHYKLPVFENLEFALSSLRPDIVVIATPTDTHAFIINKIIDVFHPKMILCEKPLAYEFDVAKQMVDVCKKANIELFVNYFRRADQGAIEIKRRIDVGEIKAPIKINVWYSKGIFNNGSHFIDLLNFWLGDMISTKIITKGRLWDSLDPEPDFKIEYSRGTAIFRALWEESFSHFGVELLSPSGRLLYDKINNIFEWQNLNQDTKLKNYPILNKQKEIIKSSYDIYQWCVYDHIHKYLIGDKTNLCTGKQALKAIEGIETLIK